jgi:uncharacterized protein YbaR (Trm112 family)
MPATPANPDAIDNSDIARLACPVCYGVLRAERTRVICTVCCRAYPVVEGILALIAERAEIATEPTAQR